MTTPPNRLPRLASAVLPAPHQRFPYAAVAAALAVYLVSYPVIEALGGSGAGIAAVLPAGMVAWYFGARAGVVAAVLLFPANLGLRMLTSDPGVAEWLQSGSIIGHAALLGTTLVIGLLRDMAAKARRELRARQRVEAELRLSEDRYRSLYANTPVMMHSVDREFRLSNVNSSWADVMGYEPEEVIGREITELLTEESRRYVVEVSRPHAISTGGFKDVPLQMVKKGGEVMDVLCSGVSVTDNDKNVQSFTYYRRHRAQPHRTRAACPRDEGAVPVQTRHPW